jgi:hypothetical protein
VERKLAVRSFLKRYHFVIENKVLRDVCRSVLIVVVLWLVYVAWKAIVSSPYYHLFERRFDGGEYYNLKADCSGFGVFNHLVSRDNDQFLISYVENEHLRWFSLVKRDSIDDEVIYIQSEKYPDFVLIERTGFDSGRLVFLYSQKYGVLIGVDKYQLEDDFFQNFMRSYGCCLKKIFQ